MGNIVKPIPAMLITFTYLYVSCAHSKPSQQVPRTKLELAAEKALIDRAGKHFESVKCLDLQCDFEYSMLVKNSAAEIANETEGELAENGFHSVKVSATESLSSAFLGSIVFGVGMGLAAAIFAAL